MFSKLRERLAESRRLREERSEETRNRVLSEREAVLNESEETARVQNLRRKQTNAVLNAIMTISYCVLVVCALEIVWYYYKGYQYTRQQEEISVMMKGGIADSGILERPTEAVVEEPQITFPDEGNYEVVNVSRKFSQEVSDRWKEQYQYLTSVNPDCFGYIEIPDTKIKMPVMFTPQDYEHYLYRNFSDSYETRGTPFLDIATRLGESQNYIIYAHNMRDGSAFGTLPEYLDRQYYEDHKYIYFNTAVSEGVYEIIAVCKTRIYSAASKKFRYHIYGGKLTKSEFETYVKEVKKMARYSIDATAVWGDELITLSTCYHDRADDNGRLIVVAKRIR